jgi:hypothetical protein
VVLAAAELLVPIHEKAARGDFYVAPVNYNDGPTNLAWWAGKPQPRHSLEVEAAELGSAGVVLTLVVVVGANFYQRSPPPAGWAQG